MKNLTLVPLGGLCNRLRALLSARSLVDHDHELRVRVVWDVNRDCAARYDELFEDHFTPTGQFVFSKSRWFDAPAVWRHNLRLPALCRSFVYSVQRADFHSDWAAGECLAHFENGDASISLRGCSCVKPHQESGEDCDLFHRFESGSTRCASAWARTPWGYTFGEQIT